MVFPGATSAKVAALNNAPLAFVLPAEFTVTIPSGVAPTLPAKVMAPVPAVNVRFSRCEVVPSNVPVNWISPSPAPVFTDTELLNTVCSASNLTLSLVVATLPPVVMPSAPAAVSVTAPSELILAPEAIVNVPKAAGSPTLVAFKVTMPPLRPAAVFTVLFKTMVSVTTFNPAAALYICAPLKVVVPVPET